MFLTRQREKLNFLLGNACVEFSQQLELLLEQQKEIKPSNTERNTTGNGAENSKEIAKSVPVKANVVPEETPTTILGQKSNPDTKEEKMKDLLQSLAQIRSNLEAKKGQSRYGGDKSKEDASSRLEKPYVPRPSEKPFSASLFTLKPTSSFNFPTLSKMDSRPSIRQTFTTKEPTTSDKISNASSMGTGDLIDRPSMKFAVSHSDLKESPRKVAVLAAPEKPQVQDPIHTKITDEPVQDVEIDQPEIQNQVAEMDVDHKAETEKVIEEINEATPDSEILDRDEVSMELDSPPELTIAVPVPSVPTLPLPVQNVVAKETVPQNVYKGAASSFLAKPVATQKPQSFITSTSVKPVIKPKPVIQALKAAENAAKKEREEKEKRAKEKEARKIAMEKKKELTKPVAAPMMKRPIGAVQSSHNAEEGPIKKKLAVSNEKKTTTTLLHHQEKKLHNTLNNDAFKKPPQTGGVKLPTAVHHTHNQPVQKPLLLAAKSAMYGDQKRVDDSSAAPSSLVDVKTGEIAGLKEGSSSDESSSSSEEEEDELLEEEKTRKKAKAQIPNWALTPNLRQALQNQVRVNPDDIFSGMEAPNLREILGIGKNSKISLGNFEEMEAISTKEQDEYTKKMGFM